MNQPVAAHSSRGTAWTDRVRRGAGAAFATALLASATLSLLLAAFATGAGQAHADARCDALRAQYGPLWPCVSVPTYSPPTTPPTVTTAPAGPTENGNGPGMHVDAGPGPGAGNGTPIVPVPGQNPATGSPTPPAQTSTIPVGPPPGQTPANTIVPTPSQAAGPTLDMGNARPNEKHLDIRNAHPGDRHAQDLGFCPLGHHTGGACIGGSIPDGLTWQHVLKVFGESIVGQIFIAGLAIALAYILPEGAYIAAILRFGGVVFDETMELIFGRTVTKIFIKSITRTISKILSEKLLPPILDLIRGRLFDRPPPLNGPDSIRLPDGPVRPPNNEPLVPRPLHDDPPLRVSPDPSGPPRDPEPPLKSPPNMTPPTPDQTPSPPAQQSPPPLQKDGTAPPTPPAPNPAPSAPGTAPSHNPTDQPNAGSKGAMGRGYEFGPNGHDPGTQNPNELV